MMRWDLLQVHLKKFNEFHMATATPKCAFAWDAKGTHRKLVSIWPSWHKAMARIRVSWCFLTGFKMSTKRPTGEFKSSCQPFAKTLPWGVPHLVRGSMCTFAGLRSHQKSSWSNVTPTGPCHVACYKNLFHTATQQISMWGQHQPC